MGLTYADERTVFFDPYRIKHGRCLKCGTATTRKSPRAIAARAGGYIRRMKDVLTLCERCDLRWRIGSLVGLAVVLSPLYITTLLFGVGASMNVVLFGTLASFPAALIAWFVARAVFLQVHSIDEDGTLGLRNVHPDARDAILELGERDYQVGAGA